MRSTPTFISLNVTAHYALSRVATPAAGQAAPEPLSTVPDIRSLFLGFHYSIAKLPDAPMRPRLADNRIGYFTTDRWDFTTDDRRIPIYHYANRWRLAKKDPAAALSEPREPIVYWIDRSVPDRYRSAIRDGVLEWNKAFERIGYKDAIKVEIQPDDADFNTSDIRHASIRWMTNTKGTFNAIGPSSRGSAQRRDPRRRHRHRRLQRPCIEELLGGDDTAAALPDVAHRRAPE